VCEGSLTALIY